MRRGAAHGRFLRYIGSQLKTSLERSRPWKCARSIGSALSTTLSGVQPSLRWALRSGRGWLNRKISLLRTPKICPLTSRAASVQSPTTNGATFSGSSFFSP